MALFRYALASHHTMRIYGSHPGASELVGSLRRVKLIHRILIIRALTGLLRFLIAIIGLQSFFPVKGEAAMGVGGIEVPINERKRLAGM